MSKQDSDFDDILDNFGEEEEINRKLKGFLKQDVFCTFLFKRVKDLFKNYALQKLDCLITGRPNKGAEISTMF